MAAIKAVRALVSGLVQGVAYRAAACDKASSLGLSGWVKNLDDGRVLIEVEGAAEAVDALVAWAKQGPPAAEVKGVELITTAPSGASRFEVRH